MLVASGTAAVINLQYASDLTNSINPKELLLTSSVEEAVQMPEENSVKVVSAGVDEKANGDDSNDGAIHASGNTPAAVNAHSQNYCTLCHIPYSRSSIHVSGGNIGKCCICKLVLQLKLKFVQVTNARSL